MRLITPCQKRTYYNYFEICTAGAGTYLSHLFFMVPVPGWTQGTRHKADGPGTAQPHQSLSGCQVGQGARRRASTGIGKGEEEKEARMGSQGTRGQATLVLLSNLSLVTCSL